MAQASKRLRWERRQRRELTTTRRALRTYQQQEQIERLQKAHAQMNQTLFQTDRLLVALLAQHGSLELTKGTLQAAADDFAQAYQVVEKDGDDNTFVVSLKPKASTRDLEITHVHEDTDVSPVAASPTNPCDAAMDPA